MVDTTPKPFVFVLMPLDCAFDDIYKLGIKQACENSGAYAERVDEQIFEGSILQRIYNQIDKADIIVADMTGRNPNVFYEVGYAHALGKYVILLTQNTDDIPFDLKHHYHIVYSDQIADKLIPDLEKRVKWAIEHAEDKKFISIFPLKVYFNNIELLNEPTIKRQIRVGDNTFVFNVNNSDLETIQSISFSPSIIVSKIFDVENCEAFPYEDRFLFTSYKKISMMPGSWKKIRFYVSPREGGRAGSNIELEELFCLQVITAHAKYEYPFTIKSTKETNESLH